MSDTNDTTTPHDGGFSLIELLLVIVVFGILTTVVALSLGGLTSEAEDTACLTDQRILEKAAEAYFAQTPSSTIPPTGIEEPYEQTLVDAEFLRHPSQYFDLDADGQLIDLGHPCT